MDYFKALAANLLNLSNSSWPEAVRAVYAFFFFLDVYQTGDLAELWRGLPLHFLVLF